MERLSPDDATRLVKRIVREGYDIAVSKHAREEMQKDDMDMGDCLNVLRAGAVSEPPDLERGTWRYRVHTARMCVVVAFRSETELAVVTAWRKGR